MEIDRRWRKMRETKPREPSARLRRDQRLSDWWPCYWNYLTLIATSKNDTYMLTYGAWIFIHIWSQWSLQVHKPFSQSHEKYIIKKTGKTNQISATKNLNWATIPAVWMKPYTLAGAERKDSCGSWVCFVFVNSKQKMFNLFNMLWHKNVLFR